MEERFIMEGVPYDVIGATNFYARREIKDVLAYLKTIDNGRDDVAVKRIINVPKRGIGISTIVRVQAYADEHQISFYDALREADQITTIGKSASKLKPFVMMMQAFRSKQEFFGLSELVKDVLEVTGYVKELEESGEEDAADRIDNIDELISKVTDYEETHDEPTLSGFLEEVALVADIDRVDGDDDRVLLMTLHSAKGLEFSQVYLAGLEDGIFPGYMSIMSDDPMEIEEERRLAYVGITRAKDDLTLTCARQRMIRGETQYNPVSRFVKEIPAELMDDKPLETRRRDPVVYNEDSVEKSIFRSKPFSAGFGADAAKPKPKAVARPKRTAMENQPYIAKAAQGVGAVSITPVGTGKLDYGVGDRVRHMRYGEGTVLKIEPGPRDSQVTVVFDEAGQKIMYAGFAKLAKI